MKSFNSTQTKKCKLCGDEFIPETRAQKYCKKIHMHPCPICGKEKVVNSTNDVSKCCSRKCSSIKRKQSNIIKYGVDNPAKLDLIKDKQAKTCVEKYGVSSPFLMDDFKEKRRNTSIEKYGTEDPMQSDVVKLHHKQSCQKKWNTDTPLTIPKVRKAQINAYKDVETLKSAASKRVKHCKNCIASDGTRLDSNYELLVYEFCLRNNLKVERQIPIEFEYNGETRITLIDFNIDGKLFECKGSHLLDGVFDNSKNIVPIEYKLEVYKNNNVSVITDNLSENKFVKHNGGRDKLIGIDIQLFDSPKFPFRDDRPECFYKVRVSNNLSIYEAFNNENIRWDMILNRIKYMGGFIDSKQIVTALNVTRKYKQPSWFSKSIAKELINKYCTSDIIVDPFAGWGTRYDAASELHRTYIGCDFNKELVDWHKSKGRVNIEYNDARKFTFNNKCSVLICPPYYIKDKDLCLEDYNFRGFENCKNITECEWLRIVMKNIPNANEYVMVCKVVDDEFKQFILDEKINQSHFGSNKEYVIVIPNK